MSPGTYIRLDILNQLQRVLSELMEYVNKIELDVDIDGLSTPSSIIHQNPCYNTKNLPEQFIECYEC